MGFAEMERRTRATIALNIEDDLRQGKGNTRILPDVAQKRGRLSLRKKRRPRLTAHITRVLPWDTTEKGVDPFRTDRWHVYSAPTAKIEAR